MGDLPIPGVAPLAILALLWTRWMIRRRRAPRALLWTLASLAAVVMVALGVVVWASWRAHRLGAFSPENKATRLAEAVSLSLDATAVAYLAVVAALVVLAVATVRMR